MKKVKRIASVIGAVLILSMYLISFLSAIFAPKGAPGLFLASIFSTVVIPILIYMMLMVYKWVHKSDSSDTMDQLTNSDKKSSR